MNIVLASDNNYAPHLATLIVSICENNLNEIITIHVLDGGINKESKNRINYLKKQYNNLEILYYEINDKIILNKIGLDNLGQDRSLTTYARIFIPEFLNNKIKKALYLDVDGIVKGSLKELFEIDNKDYAIMGVKDISNSDFRTKIGLKLQDDYICAGVLLWNLEKCRREHIVDKFKKFIISYDGDVKAMDQGTINGVLNGNVKLLHPRYNVLTPFFFKKSNVLKDLGNWDEYYSDSEIKDAITNPIFVHFTPGFTTRPWIKNCKHPLKNEYYKYRNKTLFSNYELLDDNRKFYVKFLGFIFFHFPYGFYRTIYNVLYKIFR